jgi:ribosomal protein L11 methyltransferase
MYLWRRLAAQKWIDDRGGALRLLIGDRLVMVERPAHRLMMVEVVCRSCAEARKIVQGFGGRIETLPRDWLKICARAQARPPLRIGRRLIVVDEEDASAGETAGFPRTTINLGEGKLAASPTDSRSGPSKLVVPSGAAFGTGAHATTAMTLRLLEEVTRGRKAGWSLTDLGTGSGILALAARCFGARRVTAVDNDPVAISTARANAELNGIGRIVFQMADVRRWRPKEKTDVVTANLFSELLIETLPGISRFLTSGGEFIVSGILRTQEREVLRALRRNGFRIIERRWRGKWVAILSCSS